MWIPQSVLAKTVHGTNSDDFKNIHQWPNVKILPAGPSHPAELSLHWKAKALDQGELDCLALALNNPQSIFLTDDLAARTAAQNLSIEVHGTVGVIAYAVKKRWLSLKMGETALHQLYQKSSLFITYAVIEEAVKRLRMEA